MPGGMTGQVEITPWQEQCRCLRMSSLYWGVTAPSAPAGMWSRVAPPGDGAVPGGGTGASGCSGSREKPGSWEISAAEGFC